MRAAGLGFPLACAEPPSPASAHGPPSSPGILCVPVGDPPNSFDNLFTLVAVCNLAGLLPLPFLGLLPSELDKDPEDVRAYDNSAKPVDGLPGGLK